MIYTMIRELADLARKPEAEVELHFAQVAHLEDRGRLEFGDLEDEKDLDRLDAVERIAEDAVQRRPAWIDRAQLPASRRAS